MKVPFATMLACAVMAMTGPAWSACDADSGMSRAALVELYTSEGCSSCPPADKALTALAGSTRAHPLRIVPLALHVDYWDSIGWKDPFAQPGFTKRQAWEVEANRHRTSFTPHFFVNGREVQDWRADLDAQLRDRAGPAAARLKIHAEPSGPRALRIAVDSTGTSGIDRRPLQLFVAVTESRLRSQVNAGENRGATLDHDFVVRHWIGPIDAQGAQASLQRVVDLPAGLRGTVGVTAFLQDPSTAEVVQAVDTGTCRPG